MADAVCHVDVIRRGAPERDAVVVEEPLEIRVGDKPVYVTMRTPGDDFDLAAGFVSSESVLSVGEIDSIRHWGSPNVVRIGIRAGARLDTQRLHRHFHATSACGVCGKSSIDAIRVNATPLVDETRVTADVLRRLSDRLRQEQRAFASTGSIHAAALFDLDGNLVCAREDVGRHNAVDKVIGAILRQRRPMPAMLMTSGRAGFEIVQKAVVARIPIVAAVGGPSSLAIEVAREFHLTLAAFVRDGRFNLYSGTERVF